MSKEYHLAKLSKELISTMFHLWSVL